MKGIIIFWKKKMTKEANTLMSNKETFLKKKKKETSIGL